ncbi:MAG: hypothetical protein QOE28_3012 [Solirubrobacteraceae bacterium]|jgi:hypothetical protein|nr:hypothetical protein [Solirubrobacteraceae bacterium]
MSAHAAPRRTGPPARRTPPERTVPLERRTALRRVPLRSVTGADDRAPFAASTAQREKIVGGACVVCQQTKGITPAHLVPRTLGGCDAPECVVALCWRHHRAYDTGRLELLPYLEPRWRGEVAHAVSHLGLIGALRRLAPGHHRLAERA